MSGTRVSADRAELERDLSRVARRLRTAPPARLRHDPVDRRSPVAATRAVLDSLAALAAGTDARGETEAPSWRAVPDVGSAALGDQITVLGAELTRAVRGVADAEPIWAAEGRITLGEALGALAADLRDLRMLL